MRCARFLLAAVTTLTGAISIAHGQGLDTANLQRYQRQLEQIQRETALLANPAVPAGQRLLFDYGGYLTASYLTVDDLNRNNHGLRQYDLVGYARMNLDEVHELFVRGRLSWQDFNPGDSFDGRGDDFAARIDRAYYRFDLAKAMSAHHGKQVDYDVALQGGRQLAYWANGLVLVQTLDALVLNLNYKTVDLQLLGGVTPADTIDIDSTRPQFDKNTHRGFFGAMLSKQAGEHRPFIYFLSQQDMNHSFRRFIGPVTTRFNYNSYYVGVGSNGTVGEHLAYGLEMVYEGGTSLSNSFTTAGGAFAQAVQTDETISAWAGDFRVDYLPHDDNRTRVSFETTFATGDNDRRHTTNTFGGNTSGTEDRAFNAFGRIDNGLAFSPTISNLFIVRLGASTVPLPNHAWFRNMQTGVDFFVYGKFSDKAAGDEPTLVKGYLGFEPDVFVNWQVKSDVTLALRYGVFVPGVALPARAARQFFYGGLTFAF